jgi:hypothetical protein
MKRSEMAAFAAFGVAVVLAVFGALRFANDDAVFGTVLTGAGVVILALTIGLTAGKPSASERGGSSKTTGHPG